LEATWLEFYSRVSKDHYSRPPYFFRPTLWDTGYFFEHRKFALTGSFAEGVELGIGIGKESSRAIEFHYPSFLEKHDLSGITNLS